MGYIKEPLGIDFIVDPTPLTKEDRKKEFKYYCDKCDFGTYAEILFTRHCETKKHNDITPSQL